MIQNNININVNNKYEILNIIYPTKNNINVIINKSIIKLNNPIISPKYFL